MGEEGLVVTSDGKNKTAPKLTLLPLVALIFYEVSGGPFGVEDSVRAGGGPLLALLGFLIFPLIWSVPEALVTAELATSFPENGGYVVWISSAFGPFWGFQEGFWKWFSGVMDNALYPVLFLDYLKRSFPVFDLLAARVPALLGITVSLTYLNYRGLHIVGFSAVLLAAFSLLPFAVMGLLSIPRIRPHKWLAVDFKKVEWRGYFNNLFWNLNYWDKASTLAGEVEDPSKTFPKALLGAVILVVCSYLIPLMAGTGALSSPPSEWSDGYFAEAGMLIGGVWLKVWIQAAAAMSNLGLFEAEMSGDAFQLLGMSELGMLPSIFSSRICRLVDCSVAVTESRMLTQSIKLLPTLFLRSKYGTPTISILCSATGVIFLSWMTFQEILEFLNFLYAIGMLLEFAAFIKLRIKKPELDRPYRVPVRTLGATLLCLPPTILLVLVMCLASLRTFLVSGLVIIIGMILYPILVRAKQRKWFEFDEKQAAVSSHTDVPGNSTVPKPDSELVDESAIRLLSDQPSTTHAEDGCAVLVDGSLKSD